MAFVLRPLVCGPGAVLRFGQRAHFSVSGAALSKNSLHEALLASASARKVVSSLQEIGQNQDTITWDQFQALAAKEGADAGKLGQALHAGGVIFLAPEHPSLKDVVCVRPDRLLDSFNKTFASAGERAERLKAVEAELAPLKEQWAKIEASGRSRAKFWISTSLLGLFAQGAFVARLTWWELSWDIMEPITYMLTFSTALISISYFSLTGSEFTYESLHAVLARRRREKLIRRWDFDKPKYDRLVAEAARLSKSI